MDFFQKIYTNLLNGVWEASYTSSYFASYIYDYANYMDVHDTSAANFLSQKTSSGISNLQQLKLYSDQQLNGWLGKYKAGNQTTHSRATSLTANKYLLKAIFTRSIM